MLTLEQMNHCATYFSILHGKKVIHQGISRPNAQNMFFTSMHAEIKAALWLKNHGHTRKIRVLIWRIGNGLVRPAFCCLTCTRYLQKNKLEGKFFTLDNNTILPAIIAEPKLSKGTLLKLEANAKNSKDSKDSKDSKVYIKSS